MKNTCKFGTGLFAASLLCAGVVAPASAQDNQRSGVEAGMEGTEELFRSDGFDTAVALLLGHLAEGQDNRVTVELRAGSEYKALAECDTRCSDVDLWIYDEKGDLVASDVLPDDIPLVSLTPSRSGRYTFRTGMVSCGAQRCYYGLSVFEK